MKVTVSVLGRFHAFDLAGQLLKRGHLHRLITSYPKFIAARFGIPKEKVASILAAEFIKRLWPKFPEFIRNIYNSQLFISNFYDILASFRVSKSDIFVGFSSVSLYSLRKAKKKGAKIILERGSSHIVFQNDILKEEYEKYGLKPDLPHPKIIEKELQEYQEADYVSVPSSFVKRTFLEKGFPENKLIHVPYGVNLSQFSQLPKNDDVFRVVFVGGMSIRKGVHYLLRAFSELNLPNSELLLVGSYNNEIKYFFEKYKGKYKWIGAVPQSELHKYYSQGSVFVLPSIEEGLGMVQLQAMVCGLPVVCTINTGGSDIIRDKVDGFVIPVRDVNALKEKIFYLYKNPDVLKKMGQSAKQRVVSGFTWDDYGEKMIEEYEKILNADKNYD